jgi:carbamoyltransferase
VGRTYTHAEVVDAIDRHPLLCATSRGDAVERAAELLAAGKIIGWFQEGSELGPRALGQRSILGDPRRPDLKDVLNARVKFREGFRPYAPIIPLEHVTDWFDTAPEHADSPFMLRVMPFRPDKQALVPAVVHVDGTGRVQTVTEGCLYALLRQFAARTGIPILLNTSFNTAGEPIVETPDDALRCLLLTELDACVLGDVVVTKAPEFQSVMDLYPVLTSSWVMEHRQVRDGRLRRRRTDENGDWTERFFMSACMGRINEFNGLADRFPRDHMRIVVQGRWGTVLHVANIRVADVLYLVNGRRNGWEILEALGGSDWRRVEAPFRRLLARLFRASIVTLRAEARPRRAAARSTRAVPVSETAVAAQP